MDMYVIYVIYGDVICAISVIYEVAIYVIYGDALSVIIRYAISVIYRDVIYVIYGDALSVTIRYGISVIYGNGISVNIWRCCQNTDRQQTSLLLDGAIWIDLVLIY